MDRFDLTRCSISSVAAQTARILQRTGAVAAVPTETVYGLVSMLTPEGSERIYNLKRRSGNKRLGWFVGDWRALEQYGVRLTPAVRRLAERYTPGAITIIAPDNSGAGIGFRVPDHPFLAALLAEVGAPLFQTSANLSGEPDALDLNHALAHLNGEADAAVDGGALPPDSLASTVVDARGDTVKILRQGALRVDLADL